MAWGLDGHTVSRVRLRAGFKSNPQYTWGLDLSMKWTSLSPSVKMGVIIPVSRNVLRAGIMHVGKPYIN